MLIDVHQLVEQLERMHLTATRRLHDLEMHPALFVGKRRF